MNLYTLKFNEKHLENSYQSHKAFYLQFPILKFTYLLTIVIFGSNLIESIVNQDYSYFIPKLIVLIFVVILFLLFKQFKKLPNITLIIVNFLLITMETENSSQNSRLDEYLFGSNQMLAHIILTMGCDFIYGVFANVLLGTARLVITHMSVETLAVHQYLYTIIITFGFSAILYQYELQQRRSFLYQAKDTTWEKILPFVICKPFLIFTFDNESFSFQQIAINKSLTESQEMQFDSVGDFLKECKFDTKMNLQQYLFKKFQDFNNLVSKIDCERLEIQYKKSRLRIKLLIYFIDAIRFMIVVEALDQAFIDLKYKYQNQIKSIQQKYNNQLKKLSKLINRKLKKSQFKIVSEITLSVLEFRISQSLRQTKLTRFDIQQQFKKFQMMFSKNKFRKVYFTVKTDMIVQTYKPELYYFILSLIKHGDPQREITFIFEQNKLNQVPELQVMGFCELPSDPQFIYCSQKIFDNKFIVNLDHYWHFKEVLSSYTQVYTFENISNDQYNLINPQFQF